MADQQKQPQETSEQRTRSRSKTPGLLNLRVSVEKDLNGSQVKTKKGPSVTTIQEEISASSSPLKSVTVKKTRTVTSDYSSADNTSPEVVVSVKKLSADAITEKITRTITTTTSTTSTASSKKESSSTTPAIKEVRQNEVNKVLEDTQTAILRTSTPKATSKTAHKTSKITLTPEELQRHVAYKEYKDAGEYWNKFPKTDYTYSELSPHRRELAPGMIAMPNMSRPGLTKHAERVSVMIQRNPQQESFIRQRYATSGAAGGSFAHSDPYDSGEEQLDLSQLSGAGRSYRSFRKSTTTVREEVHHRSIVSRFFLAIVNLFYGSVHSVSRLFNKSEHNMYYTRIEDERGFFGRLYALFNALLTGIFKKLYLLISTVLFLDTWLLQTSASDVAQGRRKRKFLLWLLVLLPFLLFGGIYLYLDPTPIESLREQLANPLSKFDFKLPTLPDTSGVREIALEKWAGAREHAAVWLDSLKTLSENALAEARKIWQENVNNVF